MYRCRCVDVYVQCLFVSPHAQNWESVSDIFIYFIYLFLIYLFMYEFVCLFINLFIYLFVCL